MNNFEIDLRLLRLILCLCLVITAFPLASKAQYKGDDIPGFLGLEPKRRRVSMLAIWSGSTPPAQSKITPATPSTCRVA